jgi:predicted metal-dependent phosphoesterase TrpH
MIQEARGIAVLSHPFTLGLNSPKALNDLLLELKDLGLAGIEVYYPEHSQQQEALYLGLARKLGLLITGGSDFHGANKPEVQLGRIPCQAKITYQLLERLKLWRLEH